MKKKEFIEKWIIQTKGASLYPEMIEDIERDLDSIESELALPADEDIERAANDHYGQIKPIWGETYKQGRLIAYQQGAKDMRDGKIKNEKV